MIEAKEYFERYIAWKTRSKPQAASSYEAYTALDMNTLMREADFGIPGAVEELGERCLFGLNTETDVDKACELFQQAADAGHPDAMHMLADVYRTDQHGRKDLERYFTLLPAAAERGSWKSMFNLACAYYRGKLAYDGYGFNMDHAAAFRWSSRCVVMCQELLELFFTHQCSSELRDYFGEVYDTFVQAVCASARQMIDGDGMEQDLEQARILLNGAQTFHQQRLRSECGKFAFLLKKVDG